MKYHETALGQKVIHLKESQKWKKIDSKKQNISENETEKRKEERKKSCYFLYM